MADTNKAIELLKSIFVYDQNNPYALIMLAYFEFTVYGIISQETIERIKKTQSSDPEIMAMLELVQSWHYEGVECEEHLTKSVAYCELSYNCTALGSIYRKKKNYEKAKLFYKKAIDAVRRVHSIAEYNPFDLDEFFGHYIKKTCLTEDEYNSLVVNYSDLLEKTSSS
jgi:tetratricopeptide (TPR) repeat protein